MRRTLIAGLAVVIVLLATPGTHAVAILPPGASWAKDTLASPAELVALASEYQKRFSGQLSFSERTEVDRALFRLRGQEPFITEAAHELSSEASAMAATGAARNLPVVLAAAAAVAEPSEPLIVNNFGTILHLLEENYDAVRVLRYGRTLEPKSPLILVNLANAVLDGGDHWTAEQYYKDAVKLDRDYTLAHQGLAAIYLRRGDAQKAIDELFRAAKTGYSMGLERAYVAAQGMGGSPSISPGEAWGSSEGGNGSESEGEGNVPQDQLDIPMLPNWSSLQSFLAGREQLDAWANEVIEKGMWEPLAEGLKMADSLFSGDWPEGEEEESSPLPRVLFQLNLLETYYSDRIQEVQNDYLARHEQLMDEWSSKLVRSADAESLELEKELNDLKALFTQAEAANEAMEQASDPVEVMAHGAVVLQKILDSRSHVVEFDEATQENRRLWESATDQFFSEWKTLTRDTYRKEKLLLEEYWLYSNQLFGPVGPRTIDYVNDLRKQFVYGSLAPLALNIGVCADFVFPLGYMSPTLLAPHDNKIVIPVPDPPMEKMNVPDKKAECPIKTRQKAGLGAVSMAFDCESVELEFTEGFSVSGKWNFKKKEGTLFVGGGLSARRGTGANYEEVTGKTGVYVSFDQNGNFTDVGMQSEIGVNVSVGGVRVGQSLQSGIGLATGPTFGGPLENGVGPISVGPSGP